MKTLVVCCVVLVLPMSGFAARIPGYLEHFTEDDGLGNNRVYRICVGESGVKWFASWRGPVSRFDEHAWETYWTCNVADMALDHTGRVWIGSMIPPGIFYLEEGVFHGIKSQYPTIDYGTALIFAPGGNLWAGGMDWGGEPWVGRTDDFDHWTFWQHNVGVPWWFDIDAGGGIWFVAGLDGVYRISEDGEAWDRIDDDVRLPSGISYGGVYASQTGRVWVQGHQPEDWTIRQLYSDDYQSWVSFDESKI